MEHITKAQEIYLSMIGAGGQWNSFDGERIAADLRAHTRLWRSAVLTRLASSHYGGLASRLYGALVTELRDKVNLIVLRDLPGDQINMDTLFILPEPNQQDALEQLAGAWSPDEVAWIPRREGVRAMGAGKSWCPEYAVDESRFLLRLWWD